jgi:hypothetical protein
VNFTRKIYHSTGIKNKMADFQGHKADIMEVKTCSVLLSKIDMTDMSFIVTAGKNTDNLKSSISQIGLLYPPYLIYSETSECYRIVCGYLRIEALLQLGIQEAPARVFDSKTDEKKLSLFSFYDNLSHRKFNPVENANIVERLLKYYPEEKIIGDFLPLLGIPPSVISLDNILSIIKLENEIKEAILKETLTEKNAVRLSYMEKDERLCLFRLFGRVNFSASKQAEIIENCRDISIRDKLSISEIVEDKEIDETLRNNKLTLSQKGDRIRLYIKKKRFPRLISSEKRFLSFIKNIELPPEADLSPPPFFEGETYRIKIDFTTSKSLSRALEILKRSADSSGLKKLLGEDS